MSKFQVALVSDGRTNGQAWVYKTSLAKAGGPIKMRIWSHLLKKSLNQQMMSNERILDQLVSTVPDQKRKTFRPWEILMLFDHEEELLFIRWKIKNIYNLLHLEYQLWHTYAWHMWSCNWDVENFSITSWY